jgi:hypothetical protein
MSYIKLYVVECATSILGIYTDEKEAIQANDKNNNEKYRCFKSTINEYMVKNDPESLALFGYNLHYNLTR